MSESNREYECCYLARGEQGLIQQALKFYAHEQQVMIQQAHEKYLKGKVGSQKGRKEFEDHRDMCMKRIDAAETLRERFRVGQVRRAPE